MTDTLHINWQGPGYYRRNPLFVLSDEGGIARERNGWRWDRTHRNDGFAHKVATEADIHELEKHYLGER